MSPWTLSNTGNQFTVAVLSRGHESSNYFSAIRGGVYTNVGYNLVQSFTLTETTTIAVSMWVRLVGTTVGGGRFNVYIDNTGLGYYTSPLGGEGWLKHVDGQRILAPGSHTIIVQGQVQGGPQGMGTAIDDIVIQVVDPVATISGCVPAASTSPVVPVVTPF